MTVKLLTEHYLEFLSLKGGCRGSSESTLVKMPPCWKSHVAAHFYQPEERFYPEVNYVYAGCTSSRGINVSK